MTIADRREREASLPPMRWHDTQVTGIREITGRMVRDTGDHLPGHRRDRLELVGYWRAGGPIDAD
ncbi:hypothetical protein [Gryllotalpicola protaetiae]|nr:hypothetical protein [Gryllotalpicola protaetiae]